MTDPEHQARSESEVGPGPDPGFAPEDLTDGRVKGNWQTRYNDPIAQRAIRVEVIYVIVITFLSPALIAIVVFGWPRGWLNLHRSTWLHVQHYSYAWLGGLLGGSLFSMKWMYHSVAKGTWNQDRRLWRIFTPSLSAGVGFTIVLLSASRVLPFFGADTVGTN